MDRVKSALKAMLTGFKDRVKTREDLCFRFSQAPKVMCIRCGEHIYYLRTGVAAIARRFAPTDKYQARADLICPACGAYLCGFASGVPMIKTDRGCV